MQQGCGKTYGRLLDNYVFDEKVFEFQALCVGIGLCILQEAGDELDGFLRPATCDRMLGLSSGVMRKLTLSRLELLCLASTTDTTRETTEGDDLFVFHDVAEVSVSLGQFHACRSS